MTKLTDVPWPAREGETGGPSEAQCQKGPLRFPSLLALLSPNPPTSFQFGGTSTLCQVLHQLWGTVKSNLWGYKLYKHSHTIHHLTTVTTVLPREVTGSNEGGQWGNLPSLVSWGQVVGREGQLTPDE